MSATPVPNFTPALPEIVLAISAISLLLFGVLKNRNAARIVTILCEMTLLGVLLLVWQTPQGIFINFSGLFISDSFSIFGKFLVVLSALLVLLVSRRSLNQENITQFEYPILILFATLGMMVMISANDLMSMFVGLELQSLSLYIIASLQKDNPKSAEAGLKYFVLGALATGLLLYGITLIYGFSGTTSFQVLASVFKGINSVPVGVLLGLGFILAGLAFKISSVPFHMWTPDVYEGTPTPITAFLAVVPKLAGFMLIARVFLSPFGDLAHTWRGAMIVLSIASMVLGAFAALNQRNVKRIIAYSAIGNMGYALIGIAVASEEGIRASLIYLVLYSIMLIGFFAALLAMTQRGRNIEVIQDLSGLAQVHPGSSFVMAFVLFSMAGAPPLAGFFGKLYVFQAAISVQLYFLVIIGVITSVVAAAYYLLIIKALYMDELSASYVPVRLSARREPMVTIVLAGVVLALILFFIQPGPVIDLAAQAASALFYS